MKRKEKKLVVIGLAGALILSLATNVLLAVMLNDARKDAPLYIYSADGSADQETNPDATGTVEMPTEEDKEKIRTPYITFTFPEDVQEQIAVSTAKGEDSTEITFTAMEYKDLVLFTVVLAKEKPDGYVLGTLEDEAAGTVYVAVNVNEQNPLDWTEAQYQKISTLQEQVNHIMIQIQEDPRFQASRQ